MISPAKKAAREAARREEFEGLHSLNKFAKRRMTCLNCRRCQVVDETDFTQFPERAVVVFCQKTGRKVPARILEPCLIADPRPARPKKFHRIWVNSSFNFGDLGDHSQHTTDAQEAYLRARWQTAPKAEIEAATVRTILQLQQSVRAMRIGGEAVGRTRKKFCGGKGAGKIFTKEQTRWLEAAYANPGLWPTTPTYHTKPENIVEIERRKIFIIEQVSQRGPTWDWKQITRHLAKRRCKRHDERRKERIENVTC